MTIKEIAEHEAAHAATALLGGIGIDAIEVAPGQGVVRIAKGTHASCAYARMVLAGPMVSPPTNGVTRWPLNPVSSEDDERKLAQIFEGNDWGRRTWDRLWLETSELVQGTEFWHVHQGLLTALSKSRVLRGERLKRVISVLADHDLLPEEATCST